MRANGATRRDRTTRRLSTKDGAKTRETFLLALAIYRIAISIYCPVQTKQNNPGTNNAKLKTPRHMTRRETETQQEDRARVRSARDVT